MADIILDPQPQPSSDSQREISKEEKALVTNWNKRIEDALKRVEQQFKRFEKNRKLLSGKHGNDLDQTIKVRANLHFANMAALLPQVYAKDPEFAVSPKPSVSPESMDAALKFAETAEIVLTECLVKDAGLKKQAKKMLRSTYATSIGWLKASWQENRKTDPLIINQIKDTQDNIDRLEMLNKELDDPQACANRELALAELKQTLEGLQTQQEVTVARGLVLDFLNSEDVLIIDDSVRTVSDYPRSSAIAHRVWMTPDQYKMRFGYAPKKAKSYKESNGNMVADDKKTTLLCVWEIWSQDDNRIYYLCIGEEGFCSEPKSPDWTGKRWFPFFLCAFNEIDGSFYPLSDIELTEELVDEYNKNRDDFVRDRQQCLPLNVVRQGGALTDDDVKRLQNRQGGVTIVVSGTPGTPLANDIFSGSLGNLNPVNYDTAPARADMEMILGGGDAQRGTVMKAKTATEAEIVAQGLRGRSAERQDIIEDMLNELGMYALEILLRKMTEQEVKTIAGANAMWPSLSVDQIFGMINVEVRSGSTGKPDRLQDQDRWTKLLPVIKECVAQVSELRQQGQDALAQAVIELTRETLRRFDERIDIEQFLPKAPEGEDDPSMLKQQVITMKQQLEMAMQAAKEAEDKLAKGYVEAATQIATSINPPAAASAFQTVLQQVTGQEQAMPQAQQEVPPAPMDQLPPEAPLVSPEPSQLQ